MANKSKSKKAATSKSKNIQVEENLEDVSSGIDFEMDKVAFTEKTPVAEESLIDVETELSFEAAVSEADESDPAAEDMSVNELDGYTSEEISGENSELSELADYDSAEIEEVEALDEDTLTSIVESVLFSTDKPQSVAMLKSAVQGTSVRVAHIRAALDRLKIEYSNPVRGVTLEEVAGGFQLRTKPENQKYLLRTVKARPFKLSGPALEVLSIVAYKQPCTKSNVDEIRGVESGHLMRGLLDRGLIQFGEKSEMPGRPMFYETTRKFLEIFSLRNLQELPSLNEIDQLIPEGIGETVEEKETLSDLTGKLSTEVIAKSYSENEEELLDISSELKAIHTTTEFFEQEKQRQKNKRDMDRAQDIRERLTVGEAVDEKDKKWLAKFEADQAEAVAQSLINDKQDANFSADEATANTTAEEIKVSTDEVVATHEAATIAIEVASAPVEEVIATHETSLPDAEESVNEEAAPE